MQWPRGARIGKWHRLRWLEEEVTDGQVEAPLSLGSGSFSNLPNNFKNASLVPCLTRRRPNFNYAVG